MDKQKLSQAMQRTWNAIGGDIIEAGGGSDVSRDTVIEVVLDANYLETYGDAPEDVKAFRAMSYDDQDAFALTVFTFSAYGY